MEINTYIRDDYSGPLDFKMVLPDEWITPLFTREEIQIQFDLPRGQSKSNEFIFWEKLSSDVDEMVFDENGVEKTCHIFTVEMKDKLKEYFAYEIENNRLIFRVRN